MPEPLSVICPWCHAAPGERCTIQIGQGRRKPLNGYHPSRHDAATGELDEPRNEDEPR